MLSKELIAKMRKATEKQADEIRNKTGWKEFSKQFDREYALAVEIQKARIKANLSQKEIAQRMHTTQSVVSRIESGANVSIQTLSRYATACGRILKVHLV